MKATRDSFGEELAQLGSEYPQLVVLDADLSKSTKSNIFAKKFPDRFFEMGIAEANMIGTAAGLALSGKIAFACSFGCFLSGRYDQIRMSVAYNRANVKLIGTHAGIAIGEDGHSQMGLEDIGLLRALPGFQVLQPADDLETRAMVRYVTQNPNPCYLRLTRQKVKNIYSEAPRFQAGRWDTIQKGKDLVLIGTGGLVGTLQDLNRELGNRWTLVNASSLNPVDDILIQELAKGNSTIVTVEDHYIVGGLGSAVAEVLAEVRGARASLVRIGMKSFGESGDPDELYRHYQFDLAGLKNRLKEFL